LGVCSWEISFYHCVFHWLVFFLSIYCSYVVFPFPTSSVLSLQVVQRNHKHKDC
jgi:hypothetical protein